MANEEIKKVLQEQQEQTERYIGAIKEDTDHKFAAIMEYVKDIPDMKERLTSIENVVKDIPEMKQTLDATFEKVGEVAVDVEVIKETVKQHEQEIHQFRTK